MTTVKRVKSGFCVQHARKVGLYLFKIQYGERNLSVQLRNAFWVISVLLIL